MTYRSFLPFLVRGTAPFGARRFVRVFSRIRLRDDIRKFASPIRDKRVVRVIRVFIFNRVCVLCIVTVYGIICILNSAFVPLISGISRVALCVVCI